MLPSLDLRASVATVDAERRTAELIFTTGAAVERVEWYSGKRYLEVLSLDPKHVRLARLNSGAPLLDTHSRYSVHNIIGAVVPDSARVQKSGGVATVQFSRRPELEPIFQDVRDGIIRFVSVGYHVHKFLEGQGKDQQIPTRTAVDWEPFEVSMVAMPADPGAQVRAGAGVVGVTGWPCEIERQDVDDADRDRRYRWAQARADNLKGRTGR